VTCGERKMAFKFPDLQYFGYEIKEWWERLEARKWINRNPKTIIRVTIASVAVLLVIVVWLLWPEKTVKVENLEKEWFYDLNSGELFTARIGQSPPIESPSGPLPDGRAAGVRAYVFSYVDEPNEAQRFIGFLETVDPNAQGRAASSTEPVTDSWKDWGRGRLIRRVEDKRWAPADSEQGRRILRGAFGPNKKGERARYYRPE